MEKIKLARVIKVAGVIVGSQNIKYKYHKSSNNSISFIRNFG